jgi:hypothetical protein
VELDEQSPEPNASIDRNCNQQCTHRRQHNAKHVGNLVVRHAGAIVATPHAEEACRRTGAATLLHFILVEV